MTSFIWCNNDQKRFSDSFSSCMYIPNNASDRETPTEGTGQRTHRHNTHSVSLCASECVRKSSLCSAYRHRPQ